MRILEDVRTAQRIGSEAEWIQVDPILAGGEIGVEENTGRFKIGDGVSPWHLLTYYLDEYGVEELIETYLESIGGGTLDPRVGDLTTLTTENKTTVVAAINELNALSFNPAVYYQSAKLG